jgi:prolyl oligopeptidase PreP (S9A serine peptidase family)
MSIEKANQLNQQSASMLVDAGAIEVKAGVKTNNKWLKMGTEIDNRVALANQEATKMESDALLLMSMNPKQAASMLEEAATIRQKAVIEKYKAAQGLQVMMYLFGKKSKSRRRQLKARQSRLRK